MATFIQRNSLSVMKPLLFLLIRIVNFVNAEKLLFHRKLKGQYYSIRIRKIKKDSFLVGIK